MKEARIRRSKAALDRLRAHLTAAQDRMERVAGPLREFGWRKKKSMGR